MPQDLRAELEIRTLVARYADAVGRRDEAAWAATWDDAGEWEVMGRVARGRDAAVALWHELLGGLEFVVQLASNGILEIDGDRGVGRWSVTEFGKVGGGGASLLNLGLYEDAYTRVPEGWRFARRRFHALYVGPADLSAKTFPPPKLTGLG